MNDNELDRLLMRANPYGDETVRKLTTDDAVSDLLEDIISTDTPTPKLRRSVRRRTVVLVAAAAAVAIALTGVFFPRGNPAAPVSAYGAEFRAVTDATPRLVIDDPAWKIVDIPAFRADEGEIRFGRDKKRLQVNWYPVSLYAGYLQGTKDPGKPAHGSPIEALGQKGTVFQVGTSTDLTAYLPPKGRHFLMIRGDVGSLAAYRSLLAKLKTVDTEAWLDAMPDTIVKQSDAPRVIDEMLADVPVPNGFDRTPFLKILVLSRYQFGAKVTGAISCGWLAQWNAAKKAGDAEKMQEAVTALAGSRSWKILQEMDKQGGWSYWIWAGGDALRKGDMARVATALDCRS
ncbi:hypothetical protein BWI15_22745 [Kribbella sp. ALI-6-A]|uniref:hypothetical protein n=1 Tax=Kribbella sp. ALI-6-A TaxID=1933817 RepID=UPI00097C10D9|nr:hypothetical protein [Kribbella sp. ALI-6-A]ONI69406.1 hypothetical protein BWI15_22745 [Kribbella sp. ALI-6-A]